MACRGGVLPDGRLVLEVEGWSGDRRGKPGKRPHGLYVSDRRDRSRLEPLPGGEAPAVPKGMLTSGRHLSATATLTDLRLTSLLADRGEVELSTDGGRTWERVVAR